MVKRHDYSGRWNVMAAVDIGRVCVKLLGREAGKKCIVVDIVDKNFVLITGPKQLNGVKRRRVNISHIEPTERRADIKRGESDEELMKALDEATQNFLREAVRPQLQ
jgi:large subunit ribosomal protein L14e